MQRTHFGVSIMTTDLFKTEKKTPAEAVKCSISAFPIHIRKVDLRHGMWVHFLVGLTNLHLFSRSFCPNGHTSEDQ